MTPDQEIDARRAREIAKHHCCAFADHMEFTRLAGRCLAENKNCECIASARAIRESDTAAGFGLFKIETLDTLKGGDA